MRRLVDGVETELSGEPLEIVELPDRLVVRSSEGSFSALAARQGDAVLVSYRGRSYRLEQAGRKASKSSSVDSGELRAPMPGVIVAISAGQGEEVKPGQPIVVLEAMKTQYSLTAPFAGRVENLEVMLGESVSEGTILAFLTKSTDNP